MPESPDSNEPKRPSSNPSSTDPEISRRNILQIAGATAAASVVPTSSDIAHAQPRATSPQRVVALNVNGNSREVVVDIRQSLLDVLRESLDLTGTKKGCNQGACGACTILVDGRRVVSCLTLAAMHDGAKIETIESLASGETLHPLQAAFIKHDGMQCGFCTPGQIMSGIACISEGHANSPDEIRFWMSGNICRCAAYPGIVAAISEAAGGS